jgi:hypothetical protein
MPLVSNPQEPVPASPPGASPRWRHRWLVMGGLAVVLILTHRPLLRLLAWPLVADGSGETRSAEPASAIVLGNADRSLAYVADQVRNSPGARALLIEASPTRLEMFGIFSPRVEAERCALLQRGVPDSSIEILAGAARTDWDRARALGRWLTEHPGRDVALVCGQFGSRRQKVILDRVLGADAARVRLAILAERGYDATNWWQAKEGLLDWWNGMVKLSFVWLVGEGDEPEPGWDPEAYEGALR